MTLLLGSFCGCSSRRFTADAASPRHDPTGSNRTRSLWVRDYERRWGGIKQLIRKAVVDLDVLGIGGSKINDHAIVSSIYAAADARRVPGKFEFKHSSAKTRAFMGWLNDEMEAGVIGIQVGTPKATAASESWQNVYIDTAYQKGIRDAYGKLDQGTSPGAIRAAFNSPVHADKVGLIYTRTYEELQGITAATSEAISSVLAEGLAEGLGPVEIAANLTGEVDDVGLVRARLIARTEVTAAHAEATLNTYEDAEIAGVTIEAEFTTAGDDKVCPDCEELEGKEFSIEDARGVIPVHPNCRCAFVPVVGGPS